MDAALNRSGASGAGLATSGASKLTAGSSGGNSNRPGASGRPRPPAPAPSPPGAGTLGTGSSNSAPVVDSTGDATGAADPAPHLTSSTAIAAEPPQVVLGGETGSGSVGSGGGGAVSAAAAAVFPRSGMYPASRRRASAPNAPVIGTGAGRAQPLQPVYGGEDGGATPAGYHGNGGGFYSGDAAAFAGATSSGGGGGYYSHPADCATGGSGVAGRGYANAPHASGTMPMATIGNSGMAGSTGSGSGSGSNVAGAADSQTVPLFSFPYQGPTTGSVGAAPQYPTPHVPPPPEDQQQPYNASMGFMDQGSTNMFTPYHTQQQQQQQHQQQQQQAPYAAQQIAGAHGQLPLSLMPQRPQTYQGTSGMASTGAEGYAYGYYASGGGGAGPGARRGGHARTGSSGSVGPYYAPPPTLSPQQQQQQQQGYAAPSSNATMTSDGDVSFNSTTFMQPPQQHQQQQQYGRQQGPGEGFYPQQVYPSYASYGYQGGHSTTHQQHQQQQQQQQYPPPPQPGQLYGNSSDSMPSFTQPTSSNAAPAAPPATTAMGTAPPSSSSGAGAGGTAYGYAPPPVSTTGSQPGSATASTYGGDNACSSNPPVTGQGASSVRYGGNSGGGGYYNYYGSSGGGGGYAGMNSGGGYGSAPAAQAPRHRSGAPPYADARMDGPGTPFTGDSGMAMPEKNAAASGGRGSGYGDVSYSNTGSPGYYGYGTGTYRYYYDNTQQGSGVVSGGGSGVGGVGGAQQQQQQQQPAYGYDAGFGAMGHASAGYGGACGAAEAPSSSAPSMTSGGFDSGQRGGQGMFQPPQQLPCQRGGSFNAGRTRYGDGGRGGGYSYAAPPPPMPQQAAEGYYREYGSGPQDATRAAAPSQDTRSPAAVLPLQQQQLTKGPSSASGDLILEPQEGVETVDLGSTQPPLAIPASDADHAATQTGDTSGGSATAPTETETRPAAPAAPSRKKAKKAAAAAAAAALAAAAAVTAVATESTDAPQAGEAAAANASPSESLAASEALETLELPPPAGMSPLSAPLTRSTRKARRNGGGEGGASDAHVEGVVPRVETTTAEAAVDERAALSAAKERRRATITPASAAAARAEQQQQQQQQHPRPASGSSGEFSSGASHGTATAAGASFLRRSPLTQCVGAPFHTYICGAIVGQAAQMQASSSVGGSVGVAGAGTPPASLSTASSQVLPAMYAPVQRMLSRETSRAEDREHKLRTSDSRDDVEGGDYEEEARSGVAAGQRDDGERGAPTAELSKETAEGSAERRRSGSDLQSSARPLTTDALAAVAAAAAATAVTQARPAQADGPFRTPAGRPHQFSLTSHHHSHHMRHPTQGSEASSPTGTGMPHHRHAYHGGSPFLQPAALAANATASPPAPGSVLGTGLEASPVSSASAAAAASLRLPSAVVNNLSTNSASGQQPPLPPPPRNSREGSGAAATMQGPSPQQQPPYPPSTGSQSPQSAAGRPGSTADRASPEEYEGPSQHYRMGSSGSAGYPTSSPTYRQHPAPGHGGGSSSGGGGGGPFAGPGGASSHTPSPATIAYGTGFPNTPSQGSLPHSGGAAARPGFAVPTPSTSPTQQQQQQQQRTGNNGGVGRVPTSPRGGSQHGSMGGGVAGLNNMSFSGGNVHAKSPSHQRYSAHGNACNPNGGYHRGNSQNNSQSGGRYAMPVTRSPYIYEHHVGQEVLLEEFHTGITFSAAAFGNIACLVDALSPQVPVARDLAFPCDEAHCQLVSRRSGAGDRLASSSPGVAAVDSGSGGKAGGGGGQGSPHGSGYGSRSGRACGALDDTPSTTVAAEEGEAARPPAPSPAEADRTHYWDFTGPYYCEPVLTLKSIWQSFDNPFGCVVNLAEPIYPAPMRSAEDELVYTPLLSGFRIRFHPASPAHKRLGALREVRRQRRREEAAAAAAAGRDNAKDADSGNGGATPHASYAEEDGVLTWSAGDRPNNRNIIMEQILELARRDESYAELLSATTADVDHQSWVALTWQPVFCGGHSAKHSCGTFLAYYLLRPPRHLFVPFADKSEGAAMNSSWLSPVFRGDRAALAFDLWSLQRHYHVARWVSQPPMSHLMTALCAGDEDEEGEVEEGADMVRSSRTSASRARSSWEDGQTGGASNRTAGSLALSANGDQRLRLRDVFALGHVSGGSGGGASAAALAGAVNGAYATPATTTAATQPAGQATPTSYVRVPLVGLIPNRCRSEVWYKPVYDAGMADTAAMQQHPQHHHHGGGVGGDGTGAANGMGGGVGRSAGGIGDHGGSCAFYAPLFLVVTALQLMCWDAYNEWERKPPTSAAVSRALAPPQSRRDSEEGEGGGAAGASPSPLSNPLTAMVEETMAAAQQQQQRQSAPETAGGHALPNPWSAYVMRGVALMTEAARQYRTVREAANLDAAMEESAAAGAAAADAAGGGGAEESKARGRQPHGPSAAVAGGTSSALCDPVARVIAGLLDYYQWAQYDTSLTALANTYCSV